MKNELLLKPPDLFKCLNEVIFFILVKFYDFRHPSHKTILAAQCKTLVVQGGTDAYIGILGLGAVKPGRLAFITGSSHLLLGHTDRGFHKEGIFGAFPDCVMPGLYVVEGAQISSGSVLKWFRDNFISREYEEEARRAGLPLYDYLNPLYPASAGVCNMAIDVVG